jgi:hypothetical protein
MYEIVVVDERSNHTSCTLRANPEIGSAAGTEKLGELGRAAI